MTERYEWRDERHELAYRLRCEGHDLAHVAESCGVTTRTLYDWQAKYGWAEDPAYLAGAGEVNRMRGRALRGAITAQQLRAARLYSDAAEALAQKILAAVDHLEPAEMGPSEIKAMATAAGILTDKAVAAVGQQGPRLDGPRDWNAFEQTFGPDIAAQLMQAAKDTGMLDLLVRRAAAIPASSNGDGS